MPLRRPDNSGAPKGWVAKPLLWLRVATSLAPAAYEDRGIIRQSDRERMKSSLMASTLTARLGELSECLPASALADHEPPPYKVLGSWELLVHGFQTASHAVFRVGGDASAGISALLSVGDLGYPPSGSVLVELDVGVSIKSKLLLYQVGQMLRDGLVLVTATIPDSIGDLLPPDAEPATVELHVVAATDDGNRVSRENNLGRRVDVTPLGAPTPYLDSSWSFAASVSQPFETRTAVDFVIQALERIVLDAGITEPDRGLEELTRTLTPYEPDQTQGS